MTTYKGFSGTNPPPATWRPGARTSPWNIAVDKSKVHPKSQAKVDWLLSFDDNDTPRGLADVVVWDREASGRSGAHAVCYATETDPEFTIRQVENWFPDNNGKKVRIPAAAEAGQDGYDYQLSVVAPDGSSWEFWQFERKDANRTYAPRNRTGGGELWTRACGRSRIDGDLISDYGEATQGHFDLAAGQIRGEQMVAGRIRHALFLVVPGSARSGYFVPPVPAVGGKPAAPPGGTEKIDVGQRLFLDYTGAEINALPLKAWEKVIYKALSRFGGYVGDGGGPSVVLGCVEGLSGSSYVPFGSPDPWVNYAKQFAGVYNGGYVLRWTQGVIDWRNRLKVAA